MCALPGLTGGAVSLIWFLFYAASVIIYFYATYHCLPLNLYHSLWNAFLGFTYQIISLLFLAVIRYILERKGIIKPPPPKCVPELPEYPPPAMSAPSIEEPTPSPELSPPTIDDMLDQIDCMEGSRFEKLCSRMLFRLGFSDIQLTKTIGDQGVDIIATKNDIQYAFQCKCYSSDIGNHSVQEVHAGKSMYHCHVGVVITNRYFTSGAKELAKATGTLLWDRDKLKSILQFILAKNELK